MVFSAPFELMCAELRFGFGFSALSPMSLTEPTQYPTQSNTLRRKRDPMVKFIFCGNQQMVKFNFCKLFKRGIRTNQLNPQVRSILLHDSHRNLAIRPRQYHLVVVKLRWETGAARAVN